MNQSTSITTKLKNFSKKPYLAYVVILTLFALTFIKPVEKGVQALFTDKVYQANVEYLEKTSNDALISFGITSGIKAILAVANRFPIAGGLVKPVEDFVDIAWQATFYATIILKILYYLLYFSHSFEFTLLAIFLITLLVTKLLAHSEILSWLKKISASLAYFSLAITLFIWLVMPLSIQGARLLSDMTSKNLIASANKEITKIEQDLNILKKDLSQKIKEKSTEKQPVVVLEKESSTTETQDKATLDKVKNFFSDTMTKIKKSAKTVAKEGDIIKSKIDNTVDKLEVAFSFGLPTYLKKIELYTTALKNQAIQMIVGYALNCLIFPFLFIFLLSRFIGLLKEQFLK